jgi:hypothetical protein
MRRTLAMIALSGLLIGCPGGGTTLYCLSSMVDPVHHPNRMASWPRRELFCYLWPNNYYSERDVLSAVRFSDCPRLT